MSSTSKVPAIVRLQVASVVAAAIEGGARLELKPEVIASRALDIADALIADVATRETNEREADENNIKVS